VRHTPNPLFFSPFMACSYREPCSWGQAHLKSQVRNPPLLPPSYGLFLQRALPVGLEGVCILRESEFICGLGILFLQGPRCPRGGGDLKAHIGTKHAPRRRSACGRRLPRQLPPSRMILIQWRMGRPPLCACKLESTVSPLDCLTISPLHHATASPFHPFKPLRHFFVPLHFSLSLALSMGKGAVFGCNGGASRYEKDNGDNGR